MSHHNKYDEVKILVNANIPVLLTGEKGSGKTTLAVQIAEDLDLKFFSMSMTRQTTLSHLLGFLSVNGTYIPSQLHNAAVNGGVFLLDEIDAADANVLLSLNTIENGFISFPTGIIEVHQNFRLMATANPQNQHEFYVGRSKLDAATLDRFDIVSVPRDNQLEQKLVDADTNKHMELLRRILQEVNSSTVISMRDSLRYQKRKHLNLLEGVVEKLIGDNEIAQQKYAEALEYLPKHGDQSECKTWDELASLMKIQAGVFTSVDYAKGHQSSEDNESSENDTPSEPEFKPTSDYTDGDGKHDDRTDAAQHAQKWRNHKPAPPPLPPLPPLPPFGEETERDDHESNDN